MNLGVYTLIKKIAEGGVADIYLAKTKSIGRTEKYLVCKCLRQSLTEDNEFLASIINEAQCTTHLRHINILEVFDLCICDGRAFLTMEYLDAQDLSKLIINNNKRGEVLPYDLAVYVFGQVALGLHAAHEMTDIKGNPLNLVHRDISPENILFGSNGDIKLGDFGIAKTSQMPDITPPDVIKGKFSYMSPEQAWGDKIDRRSDIYSLAASLYEATTGCSFYPADSIEECLSCARMALYKPPHEIVPDYPADLEMILGRALDLDKNNRFPTAFEFKLALDNFAVTNGYHATRDTWTAYMRERVTVPREPLPLLHAHEVCRDNMSVLSSSGDGAKDIYATGQISHEELEYILAHSACSCDTNPICSRTNQNNIDDEDTSTYRLEPDTEEHSAEITTRMDQPSFIPTAKVNSVNSEIQNSGELPSDTEETKRDTEETHTCPQDYGSHTGTADAVISGTVTAKYGSVLGNSCPKKRGKGIVIAVLAVFLILIITLIVYYYFVI